MYNIGVDIGGSKIAIGIVNSFGEIIDKKSLLNGAEEDADSVIRNIYVGIEKLLLKNSMDLSDVKSIGVGFPGKVAKNGLVNAPNIAFIDVDFEGKLSKFANKPVYVDNDANCATIGEYVYGSLRNTQNSILITLGTGVGGGIIINGNLYRGTDGQAGELGHQVIMVNGKKCGCGRYGCYEAYASTRAWVDRIRYEIEENSIIYNMVDGDRSKISARKLFEAMKKGDDFVKDSYKEHIKYIVIGMVNLIQMFSPDSVAIGGGISGQKETLLNPIKEELKNQMVDCKFKYDTDKIKIAELGNDAGIIGAAELYKFK